MSSNYKSIGGPICLGPNFKGADLPRADFFRGPICQGPIWQKPIRPAPITHMYLLLGLVVWSPPQISMDRNGVKDQPHCCGTVPVFSLRPGKHLRSEK